MHTALLHLRLSLPQLVTAGSGCEHRENKYKLMIKGKLLSMHPSCWGPNSSMFMQDAMDMIELAVSAASMLSTRADGRDRLRKGGCIAALVAMFKPGADDLVLEHIGSALGNVANHNCARQQMKDAGMIGLIARVLRLSHRPRAQVCLRSVCLLCRHGLI